MRAQKYLWVSFCLMACSQVPVRDVRPASDASVDRRDVAATDTALLEASTVDNAVDVGAQFDASVEADASDCAAGLTRCGSVCVNLVNDANHCGACGNACPVQYECLNRRCRDL